MAGHLIVRLVAIFFGLFLAMLAAGLFLSFGLFSGFLTEFFADLQGALAPDPYYRNDPVDTSPLVNLLVIVIGFLSSFQIAGMAALPTFLAIALAEGFRWRGLTINLVLGGAVALATGLSVFSDRGGVGLPSDGALVVLLATGFIGGFVYWLIAGRSAGKWLDQASGPQSPSSPR